MCVHFNQTNNSWLGGNKINKSCIVSFLISMTHTERKKMRTHCALDSFLFAISIEADSETLFLIPLRYVCLAVNIPGCFQ
jgi:hypothetical protein